MSWSLKGFHEQRYLSAVFSELVRIGHLKTNPIGPVREVRVKEREMSFLTIKQCSELLEECRQSSNEFVWSVAMICLATGASWIEAETLKNSGFVSGKVIFRDTKNGKSRAVPIDPKILEHALPGPGRLFGLCRSAVSSGFS